MRIHSTLSLLLIAGLLAEPPLVFDKTPLRT